MDWVLLRKLALLAWTLIAVTACGGGGSGSDIAGGGIGGTGISYGPVSGFGSVIVNGVEFNTASSIVLLNGSPGPDEDPHRGLKVGMVVKVEGTFDSNGTTGTATSVTFKNNLKGPVTSITRIIGNVLNLVVLGQNVTVDSQTAFTGTTFDTLVSNNVIEVSGLPDSDGNIHATLVELKAPSFIPGVTEIGVRGTIKNLNPILKTFQINNLIVDYLLASNLPAEGLADGQFVEVKGANLLDITLLATSIQLDDNSLGVTDASVAHMQGLVTALTSPSEFTVGVQPVQTTASTVFEGGTASDIALGRRVQVNGGLTGGVLTATKISFL